MQLGVIGLGTMGANLARNAARNGATVAVYNRTEERMHEFMRDYQKEGMFVGCSSYEELSQALESPRAILIMVKAGAAVDGVINDLLPVLEPGDILIDGGNSHYKDTARREAELEAKGFRFIGMGVSGGEEGALLGPSMMPGGDKDAYEHVRPLLEKMAADDGAGGKCVSYIGAGGAGHFVKMVHNGIEYGVMQLIAESYDVLRTMGGMQPVEIAEYIGAWAQSQEMGSFLLEITEKILSIEDPKTKKPMVDVIKDAAGQKGTGRWTTESALAYGVAIPTINAAVEARIISGSQHLREQGSSLPDSVDLHDPVPPPKKMASLVRSSLELSTIVSYAQGFELMRAASDEEKWELNLSEVARIWRGGCIVRSVLLPEFQALTSHADLWRSARNKLMSRFKGEPQLNWRRIVTYGASRGIPLPATTASLTYYDSLKRDVLPLNVVQAQRDFFGAHGFERTDKSGVFHLPS